MEGQPTIVDVRDMVCAQALAQADVAMKRLAAGETLEIICNASDVQSDLLAWASALGHVVVSCKHGGEVAHVMIRRAAS